MSHSATTVVRECSLSYLVNRSGSGKKVATVEAMRRDDEDVAIGIERVLRAVAVMQIEIDYEKALEAEAFSYSLGDHRHRVEKAKAHRLFALGVMSRRTNQGEAGLQNV